MGIPMYAGVTGYYYSDNFDGDYEEYNIGADMGFMSIDAAIDGDYELANAGKSRLSTLYYYCSWFDDGNTT